MSNPTPDAPQTPVQTSQRKNLRSPLITLKIRLDDEQKFFFGYTKNLSRSGMFVATLKPLLPGQQIRVEMPLPDSLKTELRCTCEVVLVRSFKSKSTHEPGVGLKFVDLDEATSSAIDRWVQSQI
jgi:uncharacterized protein (TIGR02266 family)